MVDRPLSRQPSCIACGCEDHHVFPCECGCPAHPATGIYA